VSEYTDMFDCQHKPMNKAMVNKIIQDAFIIGEPVDKGSNAKVFDVYKLDK